MSIPRTNTRILSTRSDLKSLIGESYKPSILRTIDPSDKRLRSSATCDYACMKGDQTLEVFDQAYTAIDFAITNGCDKIISISKNGDMVTCWKKSDIEGLSDGDITYCTADNSFYFYDKGSAEEADGITIIAPESGSGRWKMMGKK